MRQLLWLLAWCLVLCLILRRLYLIWIRNPVLLRLLLLLLLLLLLPLLLLLQLQLHLQLLLLLLQLLLCSLLSSFLCVQKLENLRIIGHCRDLGLPGLQLRLCLQVLLYLQLMRLKRILQGRWHLLLALHRLPWQGCRLGRLLVRRLWRYPERRLRKPLPSSWSTSASRTERLVWLRCRIHQRRIDAWRNPQCTGATLHATRAGLFKRVRSSVTFAGYAYAFRGYLDARRQHITDVLVILPRVRQVCVRIRYRSELSKMSCKLALVGR